MSTNINNEFTSTCKRKTSIGETLASKAKEICMPETNASKQELRHVYCTTTRSLDQFEPSPLPSLHVSSINTSYLSMMPSTSSTPMPNHEATSMTQVDIEKLQIQLVSVLSKLITPENIAAVIYYHNHPEEQPTGTLKNLLPYIDKPTVNNLCKCKFCKP
uniref:MPN domain-containing protein n=1 Tax=Panagrellus redivivus TaxID=6233 RepID=A0A7E4VPJ8_PANRE